jgi:hypothetical protein
MSRRGMRLFAAWLLVASAALGALAGSTSARAEPPKPSDKALGLALFEAGRKAMADGKIDEACGKFEQSYAFEPALGTLLNLGVCHDKQGRTATAWAELTKAADLALASKSPERADYAKEQAKALEAKLSRLVVKAPPSAPRGLVVHLDGRELLPAALGTAMPLDPGDHTIEASAPGKAPFSSRVHLPPGPASQTVEVPLLADETKTAATPAPTPSVAAPAPTPAEPAPPAPEPAPRSSARLYGGIALGAVGLAGVVVGSVFGATTLSKKSAIGVHCDATGACDDEGFGLQQDAHRAATVSTIAFVVGGVALAGGVVLVATSGGGASPKPRAWLAPSIGGVAAGGAF